MITTLKCCEKCWHSDTSPCPDLIDCLISGPLCHDDEECRQKIKLRNDIAARRKVDKPVIFIGAGTCGLAAGSDKTYTAVREYIRNRNIEAEIIETGCIGFCAGEPLMDVQLPGKKRISFTLVTENKVEEILDGVFTGKLQTEEILGQHDEESLDSWENVQRLYEHPFFAPQKRWVLPNCGIIDPSRMSEYIVRGGYLGFARVLKTKTPSEVCGILEKSGLRGRGGGGFLTGKKLRFASEERSEQKYMICNADEGDPGAFMDRAVIEGDPHRLIEGLATAAYAIGATKAYVYIRAEYPLAIRRLEEALEQAVNLGLLGSNILDSGFNLKIVIKKGAGAFVCGEETALINSIEGKRGMPRPRPPYPAKSGLFGKPTAINNVETLANIPAIMVNGPDWFNSVGTETSKGTKVFALSGKIIRTGLAEVAMGTKLEKIIFAIGGGIPNGKDFKGVQIGGPSGGCIPKQHISIDIDYESLKTVGAMMGSGGLVVMDEDTCMVDVAKFFMDFIQRESCEKCIPCREGTLQMLDILKRITSGRKSETETAALQRFNGIVQLGRLAMVIKDTSLCGLGQTAPNPVLSTLRWFKDEYEEHIYNRRCPAKVCKDLKVFSIDVDKCKGCTLCAKKCPVDAIHGSPKNPHYIIEEKCVACGTCLDVCRFDAVVVA